MVIPVKTLDTALKYDYNIEQLFDFVKVNIRTNISINLPFFRSFVRDVQ